MAARDPEFLKETLSERLLRYVAERHQTEDIPPFEGRAGAQAFAGEVFAELRFPLSVPEVEKALTEVRNIREFLTQIELPPLRGCSEMHRLLDALAALWVHTPRESLGGLSPAEKNKLVKDRKPLPGQL